MSEGWSKVQVSGFVCQRVSRFRCWRFSNCHSVCHKCWNVSSGPVYFFLSEGSMVYVLEGFFRSVYFVRGFYGLGFGAFPDVQSVCQRVWYQKVPLGPIFLLFCFCGFTFCVRGFVQVFYTLSELCVSKG